MWRLNLEQVFVSMVMARRLFLALGRSIGQKAIEKGDVRYNWED